jgi:hypothetical protein
MTRVKESYMEKAVTTCHAVTPGQTLFDVDADDKQVRMQRVRTWLGCPRWRRWPSWWIAQAAHVDVAEVEALRGGTAAAVGVAERSDGSPMTAASETVTQQRATGGNGGHGSG